jgi:glycosyltransferase involved in cell wall biosynthesis
VLLQYNPFRYGRWGFAPQLLIDVQRYRRDGRRIAVMVHEAWLDVTSWRTAVMGSWQRLQLRTLVGQVDAVMTSTEAIARALGPRAVHVPVSANIVPVQSDAGTARATAGSEGSFTVGLFGRDHPSRALDYAEDAIALLAKACGPRHLAVLNLGADAPAISTPTGVHVFRPGEQTPDELSASISAIDLMLLPFLDGVSTRRSTLMAALAHGRPVLGLEGKNTDRILRDADGALALTPVGDPAAYALTAVALLRDDQLRAGFGAGGRRLYEERFDWPVTAAQAAAVLERLDTDQNTVRT